MRSIKTGASGKPFDYYEPQVEEFRYMAQKRGWNTYNASLNDDIYGHFDMVMDNNVEKIKVDHKTIKMKQDDSFIVELKGISGHPGWIYGKSDLIAQERYDNYTLFETNKVKDLCDNVIDTGVTLNRPANYWCYSRSNYNDLITMIPFDDLGDCVYEIWDKK